MKYLWQGSKIRIVPVFAHKQTLVRQERLCIFFPQTCFYFREKRTFHFHPQESMNRVITGRKLNTFARFAFQRYYIKGNLSNVCSFIDSSSSVKCKLCRNQLLRSFQQCGKAMCSLPFQKKVGEENFFFSPCAEFHHITYVNCRRNDLQNDRKFSLGKCFIATQETLQSSTRKT